MLRGLSRQIFRNYLNKHQATSVSFVEMDTVEGPRVEKRCLLTILFVNCDLQLAFLREANSCETTTSVWQNLRNQLGREDFKTLFPVILTGNGVEFSDPESIEVD